MFLPDLRGTLEPGSFFRFSMALQAARSIPVLGLPASFVSFPSSLSFCWFFFFSPPVSSSTVNLQKYHYVFLTMSLWKQMVSVEKTLCPGTLTFLIGGIY